MNEGFNPVGVCDGVRGGLEEGPGPACSSLGTRLLSSSESGVPGWGNSLHGGLGPPEHSPLL